MEINAVPRPEGWEDALTGLDGPELWRRVLVAEVARSGKYGRPLTVVVVEVEGIEELWDAWGAERARHALREVGQCLRRASRASDYCTRIAPGRFGVVLAETDELAAIAYVERVRQSLPRALPRGGGVGVRFSFGWASPKAREAPDALVRRAERRLIAELLQ